MALATAPGGGIPAPTAAETGAAPPAENYQLKWHSFSTYLHSFISTSIHSEAFMDVALFTLDGHQILAHRFVLSACSQYLHQVLKYHPKITTALPIMIALPPEITYKTLKILIQYMYSGEATVSKDVLESVLRGGDILKIKGLYKPKEESLQQQPQQQQNLHKKVVNKTGATSTKQEGFGGANSEKPPPLRTYGGEKSPQKPQTVLNFTLNSSKNENKEKAPLETTKRKFGENKQHKETVIKSTELVKKNVSNNSQLHTSIDIKPDLKAETLQFLVIKEEPIEWGEVNETEMELIEEKDDEDEANIKPEVFTDEDNTEDDSNNSHEGLYTPLTCELCTETFTVPADWVQHVQTHTDMLPAKRQRRGRPSPADENAPFPPLLCDLCQKSFPTPAEWVQHIQKTHTEFELHISNKTCPGQTVKQSPLGPVHKMCSVCNKKFPSHASMLIHKRTHTGEKPYNCDYCYKGFNVKSNLLRHLRTLHDKIINSSDVEEDGANQEANE